MMPRVEKNPVGKQIREMFEKGSEYFSVTRVDPAGKNRVSGLFLSELGEFFSKLKDTDVGVVSNRLFLKEFGGFNDYHPAVFIIGSPRELIRDNITEMLVKMAKSVPEGSLAELIKIAYIKHWDGEKGYNKFMDSARKQKEILQIRSPVLYSRKDMTSIADLFLPDMEVCFGSGALED